MPRGIYARKNRSAANPTANPNPIVAKLSYDHGWKDGAEWAMKTFLAATQKE